ncbi:AI-2E family transporter [Cellulomonas sp. PS-H5]|uniref:AI-2E family transporter n=1 Tax=Cellulomonas sp. PS-H5 TaxID=2820400 RepID=UPI001C4FAD60|nr:AI-2E family transporter [Cellulomonas sp. PS-H5]MBW0253991.1 AI-2E family transporter [Cellulomonas sp. PS-H5]
MTAGSAPGQHPVPPSVRAAAAWSWRVLAVAGAAAVGLWLVDVFRVVVVAVAVGLLLAVLLTPLARWLERRARFPSWLSSLTGVLGLVAVGAALAVLSGRSIATGLGDLAEQALAGVDQALAWLSDGPLGLEVDRIDALVAQGQAALRDNAGTLLTGAWSATLTIGQVLAGAVMALFCAFFFVRDARPMWAWTVGLLPRAVRPRVHEAGRRGLVTLAAYTRTQILVGAVDAVGIGVGAALLGVPLAVPIAVLVFMASFIPFVGAVSTGAIAVLVALVAQGPVTALLMLGVVLLVQQVEGNVLQPFLMGHAVALHPVAVLLVVSAGSIAAGIVCALFAVPVAATLNTMVRYLHGHDRFPGLGTEGAGTEAEPGPATGPA